MCVFANIELNIIQGSNIPGKYAICTVIWIVLNANNLTYKYILLNYIQICLLFIIIQHLLRNLSANIGCLGSFFWSSNQPPQGPSLWCTDEKSGIASSPVMGRLSVPWTPKTWQVGPAWLKKTREVPGFTRLKLMFICLVVPGSIFGCPTHFLRCSLNGPWNNPKDLGATFSIGRDPSQRSKWMQMMCPTVNIKGSKICDKEIWFQHLGGRFAGVACSRPYCSGVSESTPVGAYP